MDTSIKATNCQITELEEKIGEEARKMAVQKQTRHEQVQLKLEELQGEVGAAEKRHRQLMLQKKSLAVEVDTANSSGVQLEPRISEIKQKITECHNMVSQARKNEADALMPYGKSIKEVVKRIKGMKWHGDVPLGPLGVYVMAREPEKWREVLRVQLGSFLTAFAVTDARDREGVRRVLGGAWEVSFLFVWAVSCFVCGFVSSFSICFFPRFLL
jgi:chromosome segregation ATPase